MIAFLRTVLVSGVILFLGQIPLAAFLSVNLHRTPSFPWVLPATFLALWLFFRYLNGYGWPSSTSAERRSLLCAKALPAGMWLWSLFAGGLGMIAAACVAFATVRLTGVQQQSLDSAIDFSSLSPWMTSSAIASIAITAAVVEEASFRGYLLTMIRKRMGWAAAFFISALLFFLAHLSHAYASAVWIPFFFFHCAVLTRIVYFTGSILPCVALHLASDLVLLPVQYGLIGQELPAAATPYLILAAIFGVAALLVFSRLEQVAKPSPA